ncbi:hypothetical protein [Metabacillus endolithicus]|uniref:S1 motif domain-containing protein n=1 Tax=Metabacillus endolithicus TaxID=1535204 RepID=A0ABW5C3R3_9BACI|nr:hypothetical protein [Metabacillus endolithicus]UPG66104.1 hypothetical protein MVE64_27075 [Metabacillus endolithicus]
MNKILLEMLKESRERKWVQYGEVESIRKVSVGGKEDELIVILYQGEKVYCKREDFIERDIANLNGFIQTRVPFIVMEVTDEVVSVSRIAALRRVAQEFTESVKIGDRVQGTVTGVSDKNVVYLEVQGYPCIIPPEEWDIRRSTNLRETVPVGTVLEVEILTISRLENEGEQNLPYRIRLSRKALIKNEKEAIWESIEDHYKVGDYIGFKITGQAPGYNSYYCETASGINLIGNLNRRLRDRYNDYLPPGVQAKGEIRFLDKKGKRGKILINQVEANFANLLNKRSFGAF